ncbi:MAG: phosphomevalonate kinase [Candidatus Iainarchaeum archaeon]|uniref:phosphomevalonate kinase n=1 Tax=Candidatus Iainarchaeum sp. TaxID=3101447 RepID=A0A497JGS6_9ARCH|nr:MAG: phosphomevalonate kinase [Candidatus Diapherotrites archaeon]
MRVAAPGKQLISGEWSVLEYGNPAIVASINRYVYCDIEENNCIELNFPDFNFSVKAEFKNGDLVLERELNEEEKKISSFVLNAAKLALKYLDECGIELKGFKIKTDSKEAYAKAGEKKIGFGSSAAVTVATCAAILAFHGINIEDYKNKVLIYKLSALAHYLAQGKIGSAFDIAASTFGNILAYKRFNADKILQEFQNTNLKSLVEEKNWEPLMLEPLNLPEGMIVKVIYSGYSASTKELVLKMREFKKENSEQYYQVMNSIAEVTNALIEAFKKEDKSKIMELIKKNRELLKQLSDASGLNLETKELKEICDTAEQLGFAAKFSGAGGGDCAIAITFNSENEKLLEEKMKEKNYEILNVKISPHGVKVI